MKKIITFSAKALLLFAFAITSATNMMAGDVVQSLNPYLKGEKIPYTDEYGKVQYLDKSEVSILTGEETELTSGWYVVDYDVTFNHPVLINGTVKIINQQVYNYNGTYSEGPRLVFEGNEDLIYKEGIVYSNNNTDSLCLYAHETNTISYFDRNKFFDFEVSAPANTVAVAVAHIVNYGQIVLAKTNGDITLAGIPTLITQTITSYSGNLQGGNGATFYTNDLNMYGGCIDNYSSDLVFDIIVNNNLNLVNSKDDVNGNVQISNSRIHYDGDQKSITIPSNYNVLTYDEDFNPTPINAKEFEIDDFLELISSSYAVELSKIMEIYDTEDNSDLTEGEQLSIMNFYLKNRTFAAGCYNTFSSPLFFNDQYLNTTFGENNWTFKRLTNATLNDDQLSLEFETVTFASESDMLFANTPYLLKVNTTVKEPMLVGYAIDKDLEMMMGITYPETSFNGVSFVATSAKPHTVEGDKESMLFLGANNTLFYPNAMPATINGFRAYFTLDETVANAAKRISLNIDGEPTSISEVSGDLLDFFDAAGEWYTVQGVKLNGKPSTPGMFIHNGVKVTIK
ncbi:MAG: hypothetical protein K6E54_01085 [Bacteroidaceae bacterium]|nr:hypothetical protein [Bacteroidaceae bacterium]